MNKSSNKILSSFCYFSVFFAPFIFPIVVWALSNGDTSRNAKRALLYHILPMISLGLSTVLFSIYNNNHSSDLILSIVIILSTLVVESKINQSHNLQEKAKIMLFSMVPINLIVITIFWIFVF
ncbi:hypothetical protein [Staphylococcus pseudintermedius]|nr:hypothetical protein [Staphylococcus pseudintermedius]POF45041.1 hypothetical protein CYJ00_009655 [Staphylococcus pseudintermedius]